MKCTCTAPFKQEKQLNVLHNKKDYEMLHIKPVIDKVKLMILKTWKKVQNKMEIKILKKIKTELYLKQD